MPLIRIFTDGTFPEMSDDIPTVHSRRENANLLAQLVKSLDAWDYFP